MPIRMIELEIYGREFQPGDEYQGKTVARVVSDTFNSVGLFDINGFGIASGIASDLQYTIYRPLYFRD